MQSSNSPSGDPSASVGGSPSTSPTPKGSSGLGTPGDRYGRRLKAVLQNSPTQTTRWYVSPVDVQRWALHRAMTLDPAPALGPPVLGWMSSTEIDVEEMVGGKLRHRPATVEDVDEWARARGLRLLLDDGSPV